VTVAVWVARAYLMSIVSFGVAWALSCALVRYRASVRHHVWVVSIAIALLSFVGAVVPARIDVPVLRPLGPMDDGFDRTPQSRPTQHGAAGARLTREAPRMSLVSTALGVWLTGMGILLCLRLRRRRRLALLCSQARPWEGSEGVGVHEDVIVPLLAGLRRPTILLPPTATKWPKPLLDAVLLHERAHLARCDHLVAAMCDIATILYWLNPLVWLAAAMLGREREQACDDEVLRAGVKASVYAGALMRVGQTLPVTGRIRGALTLASGGLDARVRDVLADRPRRSGQVPLSWRTTAMLIALCAMSLLSVRPVARAPLLQGEGVLAVIVNGEPLTMADLERRQADARRSRPLTTRSAEPPTVLVNAIDDILVAQHGKQLGYALSDAQFASVVDNIKARHSLATDEQFQAVLAQEQITVADLRRSLELQLMVSRLQFSQSNGRGVTEEEARQYYAAHRDEFAGASFEQVQYRVNDRMTAAGRQRMWDAYLQTLRSQAVIDWKRADLKRAYDEGLAQRPR
jgi:beta-lactamase regulating signal transducer with metallopeptidase domain